MKLLVIATTIVAFSCADRLENTYLPPSSAQTAGGSGSFLAAPHSAGGSVSNLGGSGSFGGSKGFGSFSSTSGSGVDIKTFNGPTNPPIAIVRFNNDNNGDGAYKFEYETENRISAQESGEVRNAGTDQASSAVRGSYSYTGPDGVVYTVNYIADENGFQASGAHIPTPPPVPEAILKSLQVNAAQEASGVRTAYSDVSGSGQFQATNKQYLAPNVNQAGGYHY